MTSSNVYEDICAANRGEISLLNTDWICEGRLLVILVECNPYKGTGTPTCAVCFEAGTGQAGTFLVFVQL